jgi:hypothetical protein
MEDHMGIKCVWLKETTKVRRYLRRWHDDCKAPYRRLNGMVYLDVVEVPKGGMLTLGDADEMHSDPRWPKRCDCGREYADADNWQIFQERLYVTASGEEYSLYDAPVGAMWDAWWLKDWKQGEDGRCLIVKCPKDGHQWMIDGRASNCTLPEDDVHKCWCRTGTPPNITVSKDGCATCSAGGGSIQTPTWHGFLRNGELVEC